VITAGKEQQGKMAGHKEALVQMLQANNQLELAWDAHNTCP
jgi:hypothetical protein